LSRVSIQSNVEKITAQKAQVEAERDSKMVRIEQYYAEYISMNKIWQQDNEVKWYLTAEKIRIQTQACALATELFGGSFATIDTVKTNAIDKKSENWTDNSPQWSLLRKRYDISEQLKTETAQFTKRKLTQNYQQSLLNLAEVTGQHNLMEAKITQYETDSKAMQTSIEWYNQAIIKNTNSINTKKAELAKLSLTDDKRSVLQWEIDTLTATNTEFTKQIWELSTRKTKLDQVVVTAKSNFEKMKQAKLSAESTKTTSKKSLDANTTFIYTDEKSTQYKFEVPWWEWNKDWDEKRVKYESLDATQKWASTTLEEITPNTIAPEKVETIDRTKNITSFLKSKECKLWVDAIQLTNAIKDLSQSAQESFVKNPKEFWKIIRDNKWNKKYEWVYWSQTLQKIQINKEKTNNAVKNVIWAIQENDNIDIYG